MFVDESSQENTAIITTLGLYKFIRMPYGLKNAAQFFQRNVVYTSCSAICRSHIYVVYMDDVIVVSSNKEDHNRDLGGLFQMMKDAGLLLNKNKCAT